MWRTGGHQNNQKKKKVFQLKYVWIRGGFQVVGKTTFKSTMFLIVILLMEELIWYLFFIHINSLYFLSLNWTERQLHEPL